MLNPKVVLGYCDVAGAGCRALLGANLNNFNSAVLNLIEESTSTPVINVTELEDKKPTIIQLNHKNNELSLLVLNSDFESHLVHKVVAEIMDLLRKSGVVELIILSAIPLSADNKFYKLIDKGIESDLARECSSSDPMLNLLLQFIKIENFKTTLVAVNGKKAKSNSKANKIDGSEQNIEQLHKFLMSEICEDFDLKKSLSLTLEHSRTDNNQDYETELMYL